MMALPNRSVYTLSSRPTNNYISADLSNDPRLAISMRTRRRPLVSVRTSWRKRNQSGTAHATSGLNVGKQSTVPQCESNAT
jgi:hypothetical protein